MADLYRAGFRVAILIVLAALAMLPFQPPGTPQFVATVLALVVGGLFVGVVTVLVRLSTPGLPDPRDRATGVAVDERRHNG